MYSPDEGKIPSGTPGLDDVLYGGFPEGQTTILTGGPGTGKTILGLQFLVAGGKGLYIGFEEREKEIRKNAMALGIDLSAIEILDLSAKSDRFFSDDTYTVFTSEEVEGEDLLRKISSTLSDADIDRLVIDPLSELRSLLPDGFQFRRNITSLFNDLNDRGVTTVCTAQPSADPDEWDLQFLSNTTVILDRTTEQRTLEVTKYRGSDTAAGRHTFRIHPDTGGHVYPKLVPGDHYKQAERSQLSSDIPRLDSLLGGGLERGTVTVLTGPSGVGKTTTASYFLQAAAGRGERSLAFLFEELRPDYLHRSKQLGMDIARLAEDGALELVEIEALTQSPDEFAYRVRQAVEDRDVEFIVIDGISGYQQGLRGNVTQQTLLRELHALCRYLKRMGVTTILIEEADSVTGEFSPTSQHISYLADNIVFLRYLEMDGDIEKSIGVLKKRYSGFEPTIRKLTIDTDGLSVGDQLRGYRGLLTGVVETTTDV